MTYGPDARQKTLDFGAQLGAADGQAGAVGLFDFGCAFFSLQSGQQNWLLLSCGGGNWDNEGTAGVGKSFVLRFSRCRILKRSTGSSRPQSPIDAVLPNQPKTNEAFRTGSKADRISGESAHQD
jgi:hypothetical protein